MWYQEKTQNVLKQHSNLDRGIHRSDIQGDTAGGWSIALHMSSL